MNNCALTVSRKDDFGATSLLYSLRQDKIALTSCTQDPGACIYAC